MTARPALSARIAAGERLIGTFLKTPHHVTVEALQGSGLDFVILDAEHAPFDLAAMDRCLLAARAIGMPALARVPAATPAAVLQVLDAGADGFLAPHVLDAAQSAAIAASARYGAGGRGYAATNRAGGWGTVPMAEHLRASRAVCVVPQIEDPEGVDAAEGVAAAPGVDAVFIGRADLAVAYGAAGMDAPEVERAVDRVLAACRAAGRPAATFVASMDQAAAWFARGVQIVAVASEHAAVRAYFSVAAIGAAKEAAGPPAPPPRRAPAQPETKP